jgi:hypothetical protein
VHVEVQAGAARQGGLQDGGLQEPPAEPAVLPPVADDDPDVHDPAGVEAPAGVPDDELPDPVLVDGKPGAPGGAVGACRASQQRPQQPGVRLTQAGEEAVERRCR